MNQGFLRDHKALLPYLARARLGKGLGPCRTFGKAQGLALRINDLIGRARVYPLPYSALAKGLSYYIRGSSLVHPWFIPCLPLGRLINIYQLIF